jgi:pimeloyl-ACP methyl ester carboxylesterase
MLLTLTEMPRFFRPWQLAAAAVLVAAPLPALAMPDRTRAHGEAVVVLAATIRAPVLSWTVERLTAPPLMREAVVAGAPTTIARPAGGGPSPALVVVNGATPLGRKHPDLQRLVRGLARAGYVVYLPDLPGLRVGAISEETITATVEVARLAVASPEASGSRVGLVGVSVGTSIALLAAQRDVLAGRVSVVAGTAPFADLTTLVRLGTTSHYLDEGRLVSYQVDPFLGVAVARSVAAALPPGRERASLALLAGNLDEDDPDPLAPLRAVPASDLGPETRAIVRLLANRDPQRFDELFAALPETVRAAVERLSPLTQAQRLTMPLELATSPTDKYAPLSESEALARVAPRARVTVTSVLEHAEPKPSLDILGDVLRFEAWAARALAAASSP